MLGLFCLPLVLCVYRGVVTVVARYGSRRVLGSVSCPRSLHGLSPSGLKRMYTRLHRCVVSMLSRGPKRLKTDLNAMRLAITLRCIFGAPCSHVM